MTNAQRMAAFYAAVFAAIGIQLPYWPVWLKAKGLSPTEIGVLLAMTYLGKVLFNPLVGGVVDRRGDRRPVMIFVSAAAVLSTLAFAVAEGLPLLLVVTFISMGLLSAMLPVADNLTLALARSGDFDYGRVRLWGSLSFVVAANVGGVLLGVFSPAVVLWLFAAGLAATFAACLAVPELSAAPRPGPPLPLRALLGNRVFLAFLACCSLIQISHMIYYGFATLHWRAAGIPDWVIGLLWAEGVVAEVVLFVFGRQLMTRAGPVGLLIAACVGCVLRWSILATTTEVPALLAAQLLHGVTFGCTHLGAMHFIHQAAPHKIAVRAQSLYASVTVGLAPGLAMFLSGPLYDGLGGRAFLATAAIAVAATVFALWLRRNWLGGELRLAAA